MKTRREAWEPSILREPAWNSKVSVSSRRPMVYSHLSWEYPSCGTSPPNLINFLGFASQLTVFKRIAWPLLIWWCFKIWCLFQLLSKSIIWAAGKQKTNEAGGRAPPQFLLAPHLHSCDLYWTTCGSRSCLHCLHCLHWLLVMLFFPCSLGPRSPDSFPLLLVSGFHHSWF